jgi:uncharacterized membrane protein SpoIIM required for sporulation
MFSGEPFGLEVLGWMAVVFIVSLLILFLIAVYIAEVTQKRRANRRNYPENGIESAATYFIMLFFMGAGKASIDYLFSRKFNDCHTTAF